MAEPIRIEEAALLVLLDTPAAMKLAASWPHVAAKDRKSIEKWAEVAGLEAWQAKKFGEPLRRCGICLDDGTTLPLALKYIAGQMMQGAKPKHKA